MYAFALVLANFGIAIVARMPMITTTIKSSMSVKPSLTRRTRSMLPPRNYVHRHRRSRNGQVRLAHPRRLERHEGGGTVRLHADHLQELRLLVVAAPHLLDHARQIGRADRVAVRILGRHTDDERRIRRHRHGTAVHSHA